MTRVSKANRLTTTRGSEAKIEARMVVWTIAEVIEPDWSTMMIRRVGRLFLPVWR